MVILPLCMLGIFMLLSSSADFFQNAPRLSNSFDPGQNGHSVGPNVGSNCLQRLTADDKSHF